MCEVRNEGRKFMKAGRREGRRQGRREGRKEGRNEGRYEVYKGRKEKRKGAREAESTECRKEGSIPFHRLLTFASSDEVFE